MEKSCFWEELELDVSPSFVDRDRADHDDHPGKPGHPCQRVLDFRASWHALNGDNFHVDPILVRWRQTWSLPSTYIGCLHYLPLKKVVLTLGTSCIICYCLFSKGGPRTLGPEICGKLVYVSIFIETRMTIYFCQSCVLRQDFEAENNFSMSSAILW